MAVDDARVQAYFLRQSLSGADIVLQSDGTMRRTYTYISDAAAAVLCLLLAEDSGTFNIANDTARVSIRELAEAFQRNSPVPGGSVLTKPRTDTGLWSRNTGGTFLDCSRLRSIGWAPRVSIDDGVARTVRHHVDAG
jgi:dTDP-glucose 4,6-dehydratase